VRRISLLLVVVALLGAGCGSNDDKPPQPSTQSEPSPVATAAASSNLAVAVAEPSPEPTPEPTPEPIPEPPPPPPPVMQPVRMRIPRIKVDARIINVGVNALGEMDTPHDAWSIGWFAPGYKPGEPGNAVVAGHVDYINIGPAVFYNLKLLEAGDRVTVVGEDQYEYEFQVTEVQRYTPYNAPIERIFGPNPNRGLVLITCGGTFNTRTRDYDQRIVVYTEAVADVPPERDSYTP
jgi:sortase A